MATKQKKQAERKVALTAQDIRFYVIYTLKKGYGYMTNKDMKESCSLKKPMIVKGTKIVLTEDYKATESASGMREQKRCAQLTLKGLKDFLFDICFDGVCDTMGALTVEYGMLPAVSFSGYSDSSYIPTAVVKSFEKRYREKDCDLPDYQLDMMERFIGCSEENAYISPLIDDSTLDEIYRGVYEKDTEANREDFKKRLEHYLPSVYEKWMELLNSLGDRDADLYEFFETLDTSFMEIDFRQSFINFKED